MPRRVAQILARAGLDQDRPPVVAQHKGIHGDHDTRPEGIGEKLSRIVHRYGSQQFERPLEGSVAERRHLDIADAVMINGRYLDGRHGWHGFAPFS